MKSFWRTIQAAFAIACIAVYTVCATYAVINIRNELKMQRVLAEREYSDLRDFAASAGVLGFTGDSFKKDIEDAIAVSRTLEAAIITGQRGYVLAVEKKTGLIDWRNNEPRFNDSFNLVKKLESATVAIDEANNISISVLVSVIDFDSLLSILRPALLGILIAVIISFSLLMSDVFSAKNNKAAQGESASMEDEIDDKADDKIDDKADDEIEDEVDDEVFDESFDEIPDETPQPEATDEKVPDVKLSDEKATAAAVNPAEAGETEKKSLLDTAKLYESDNFGAFDDEPKFADELSPMLVNAEENSEDISLLCAAWKSPGITCADASRLESPQSSEHILTTTARKCFKAGIRIFQRSATGVYVSLPAHSIDEAFSLAKNFHNAVYEQLPKDMHCDLLIGLSSRAGRKVTAERLINESETALLKARAEKEHPIVAFHADPGKYKEFLTKHGEGNKEAEG